MKIKSALMTQASGSIAGMTASRNRGGLYLRSRVIPVNPNTARQGLARANLASAVGFWTSALSDEERQAWITYATGTPVTDRLGDSLVLSGQQMFVKSTLPRLIAGLTYVAAGPVTAGLATTPDVTTDPVIEQNGTITAIVTVPGAGTDGDLLVYLSEPTSPSRTLAHAKRAFAFLEDSPVADVFTVSHAVPLLPYIYSEGQAVRVTFVYASDDGRISAEVFRDIIVQPEV